MRDKKIAKKVSANRRKVIDEQLLAKAFDLILQEHRSNPAQSYDLFEMSSNPFLHLNVIVSQLPKKVDIRPVRIPLKHSIYSKNHNTRVLLILTNEMYDSRGKELKNALPNVTITSYHKVTHNYPEFSNKRDLLKSYDLFFCDQRVYSLLKKALGRGFYDRKKYPYPISLSCLESSTSFAPDLEAKLASSITNVTFFYQGNGPEYSIKFARLLGMSASQVCENAQAAFRGLIEALMERGLKLSDVRRVVVKGDKSDSFPLYSHLKPHELSAFREILASET